MCVRACALGYRWQHTHALSERAVQAEQQLSNAAVTWGQRCRQAEAAAATANAARQAAEQRAAKAEAAVSADAGRVEVPRPYPLLRVSNGENERKY
eukprot:COSAG05_NODE_2692_length_2766_cov_1.839895_4_plen_96_part_00